MTSELTTRDALAAVLALKSLPELAHAHPDDLIGLASRAVERRHPAGTRLSDSSDGVLFLLEGRVREAGEDGPVHSAPATLGMLPVLAGERAPELIADADAVALEIARSDLLELLEEEFELWVAALRIACRGLVSLDAPSEPAMTARPDPAVLAERIVLLRRTAPFARLPVCLLGQIASEAEAIAVEMGTPLWELDDPATHALLIVAGSAEAGAAAPARSRGFEAGALVGLPEALATEDLGFRLRARTPLVALRLEGEALIDALEDDTASAVQFLCALARHLRSYTAVEHARGGS